MCYISSFTFFLSSMWRGGSKRKYEETHEENSRIPSNSNPPLLQRLPAPEEEHSPRTWKGRRIWKPDATRIVDSAACPQRLAPSTSSSSSSQACAPELWKNKLAELFLTNKLSALQTRDLANNAEQAGASGGEKISKAGAKGNAPQNMARDITRTLLKTATLPEVYWAKIPVLDPDTGNTESVWFPFLLPHEIVFHLIKKNGLSSLLQFVAPSLTTAFCNTFHTDPAVTLAMGLHGDGAPFQAKMKDSLEQFSWNFPADPHSSRIVFTAIPKKFVAAETFNAILDVFAWSMTVLLDGVMPKLRHDSSPFDSNSKGAGDSKFRINAAGQAIAVRCALVQIRGDWAFYNHCFGFPSWSADKICWMCRATRVRNSEFDYRRTAWKKERYLPGEFETMLRLAGKLSSIFKAPGVSLRIFMVDWLHAIDLGVGQSVLGNVLYESLDILWPNLPKKQQVQQLYLKMKAWYQVAKPPSRLDALTIEMLKLPGKGPKLRSKAAECRYLLPFGELVARECDDGSVRRTTITALMEHFLQLAITVSSVPYDSAAAVCACNKVCLLFTTLEDAAIATGDELSWRAKPKLHMMQELITFQGVEFGSARNFWTYQDESWGGWLSNCAARKGGPKFAGTVAFGLLQRYRAVAQDDS